ncbi:MAG: hypothetical protein H7099_04110 [Gemmatimonadaceae bacterium]|nr:hypothetical protein [Gemmatimonadaceae bacterium]
MSTSRRGFLGWLGSASFLGAVGSPSLLRPQSVDGSGDWTGHARPIAETWDMSWTSRVTGKYKAVFDSPEVSDGAAIYRAVSWIEQYKEVYNAEPTELSAIVVLRHLGFYFAMNDEFWERYEVGKRLKIRDDKGRKWTKVNPLGALGAGADETSKKFGLAGFQGVGGIVLGCGWSFGGAASQIAKKESLEKEAARARAKTLLMPGVILQPNGVFAALRAQEAGCAYIDAS